MIRKFAKRSISLIAALAIIISGAFVLPAAEAATVKAPGQVLSIKASGIKAHEATLIWSKASGKVSGYAVYRNGKIIKNVNASTLKYSDTNLKASTKYKYYVKAYVFTGKTVKQWYNTKTKKWQTTMPAKSIRGKSRVVKQKKYGKASPTLTITTQKATVIHGRVVKPSEFTKKNNYTITYTKKGTTCEVCGKGQTVKITYNPKTGSYSYTLSGINYATTPHSHSGK